MGNLLFKTATAIGLLLITPTVVAGIDALPLGLDRKIAFTHSGFNLAMALLFLPLINPVYRLVRRLVPEPAADAQAAFGPQYLNNAHIDGLAIATGQSRQEIMRVSAIVSGMLDDLWRALSKRDPQLAQSVQERDTKLTC